MTVRNPSSPRARPDRSPHPLQGRTTATLHVVLVLFCAWHVAIVVSFYYANQVFTHDVGHDNYMLYNTWHEGRFFWSIVYDVPHFAQHFTPTHVLLVPLHALFRSMLFLPVFECLAAASAAWAVAWMFDGIVRRRRRMKRWGLSPLGLAAGVLYIATPSVGSLLMANHYESFVVALGLWTLAALVNGRRVLFWTLLVLTLGCKEDIPLYWAGFGVWWILFGWGDRERAPVKWWAGREKTRLPLRRRVLLGGSILVLCIVWALVAMAVMRATAHAYGVDPANYSRRYGWMGSTFVERLEPLSRYPVLLALPPLWAWFVLLPEVLALPLVAPATLLLLVPGAYVMGLADSPPQQDLMFYYSYPFLPFLCLGATLGLARLADCGTRRPWRRRLRAGLTILVLLASAVLMCLTTRTEDRRRVLERQTQRHTRIRMALREYIPPSASVTAQYDLLCQIPFRPGVHPLSLKNLDRSEYLVFDFRGLQGDILLPGMTGRPEGDKILKRVHDWIEAGKARVVFEEDDLFIVRRLEPPRDLSH
ncbi:DUF2079 domain-containing protein [Candidatus Sumerlaeota bacterium]|nr:DUF2079 domain-containing protein [Candidatus Sumerlaeota bacterium]